MPKKSTLLGSPAEEPLCTLFVQGASYTQMKTALDAMGMPYSRDTLCRFLNNPAHLPIIQKYREKHITNPARIDIFHKTIRLDDLNRERLAIIRTLERYKDKEGAIIEKKVSKYTTLLKKLLEVEIAGRDEVEKKPDLLAFWQRIGPYGEVEDGELQRESRLITEKLLLIRKGTIPLKQEGSDREGTNGKTGKGSA